jgi:hypothetical protein
MISFVAGMATGAVIVGAAGYVALACAVELYRDSNRAEIPDPEITDEVHR